MHYVKTVLLLPFQSGRSLFLFHVLLIWTRISRGKSGHFCFVFYFKGETFRFYHQVWYSVQFSSDQLLSRVRLFAIPWIAARQASLSITNSRNSPRLTSIKSVMPSSHLILCRPLLLLPPIPPSISTGFLYMPFIRLRNFPSVPTFHCFYHEICWILSNVLFVSIEMILVLVFYFIDVVHYIN